MRFSGFRTEHKDNIYTGTCKKNVAFFWISFNGKVVEKQDDFSA